MTSLFTEVSPEPGSGVVTRRVTLTVNGERRAADIEPRLLLAHLLRQGFGLTGTHTGCDTTNCGACTVLYDGQPVKSCTMLAVQADGHDVRTVEGLATASELHPVQEGFKQEHGLQCGFCTPGMMMAATALLAENPDPTEDEVRWALSGNLCRCTGYQNIVKAVLWAAAKLWGEAVETQDGLDFRAEAESGRTFLWYTTELDELANCDHVYVFRNGRIVADLTRSEMTEEKVLHASFEGQA